MADQIPMSHMEAATALLTKIRALRSEVPRFVPDAPGRGKQRFVVTAAVPDAAVQSASVAVQSYVRLESAAGADGLAIRDGYEFGRAYEMIHQELRAFTRAVGHTIRVQRGEAGFRTLTVLAIARRMAQHPENAELLPFIEDIEQKLKKRRRKTPAEPTTPEPTADEPKPSE